MIFVCGWEVFLEFPFRTSKCPPSLENDRFRPPKNPKVQNIPDIPGNRHAKQFLGNEMMMFIRKKPWISPELSKFPQVCGETFWFRTWHNHGWRSLISSFWGLHLSKPSINDQAHSHCSAPNRTAVHARSAPPSWDELWEAPGEKGWQMELESDPFGKGNHLSNLRFLSFHIRFQKCNILLMENSIDVISAERWLDFPLHVFPPLSFYKYIGRSHVLTNEKPRTRSQHIYSIGLGASQELPLPNFQQ